MMSARSIGFAAALLLMVSTWSVGQTPQVPSKSLPSSQSSFTQGPRILNACGYQTSICKGSPIPAGFLIVGQDTDFSCSNNFDNVWVIQRYNTCNVGARMTICKGQTIPNGWAIKGTTTNLSCGKDFDNAWIIERIN